MGAAPKGRIENKVAFVSQLAPYAGAALIGYLLGSIPFAVLLTRLLEGADIRRLGTGNPGAANVFREVGQIAGLLVGFLDIAKGIIAVALALYLLGLGPWGGALAGMAAVVGHQFSAFLRLHGGAGLATAVGGIAVLLPGPFFSVAAVGAVLVLFTRNMGWSGGTLLALTLGVASLSLVTELPFLPGALAVSGPSPVYGAFAISTLLLLHHSGRRASAWWRGRDAQAPSAREDRRRSG